MGRGGIRVPLYFTPMNLEGVAQRLQALTRAQDGLTRIARVTSQYVGFRAVLHKTISTIKDALNNIKELDKTITNIAVVTNMSQEDLWGKMGQYMDMAKQYGIAVNDVYTVSQLFYQQGLQTAQVMDMTNETLKMAKIAGMDYAEAADAMTVAVRAFNIEMTNAQRVTDVYSALAANFAVSSQEIANAMEKTASSAASVGMSIESTSAFMSVMIQSTRESAQNIGSALKSIISRYGEMKASPNDLIDVDGEEVSYNKVDKALQSIGISIKDAQGQFRDFDDVIMELSSKWKTLDTNTQRYIATIMAGNRQQSRFIALVSNTDELTRAMNTANEAENASLQQTLKTMNSLETKVQQVKSAFTDIYTSLGLENSLRNFYDMITTMLTNIKNQGLMTIAALSTQLISLGGQLRNLSTGLNLYTTGTYTFTDRAGNVQTAFGTRTQAMGMRGYNGDWERNRYGREALISSAVGGGLSLVGAYITADGLTIEDAADDNVEYSKIKTGFGELTSAAGSLLSNIGVGFAQGGIAGAVVGGVTGLITALPNMISGVKAIVDGFDYTSAERYSKAVMEARKAEEEYVAARAKASDLATQISKIQSLEKSAYSSTEALTAYHDAMNNLADSYPDLISGYDAQGNAIINLKAAEERLLELREHEADVAVKLSEAEIRRQEYIVEGLKRVTNGDYFTRAVAEGAQYGELTVNKSAKVKNTSGHLAGLYGFNVSNWQNAEEVLTEALDGIATIEVDGDGVYSILLEEGKTLADVEKQLKRATSNFTSILNHKDAGGFFEELDTLNAGYISNGTLDSAKKVLSFTDYDEVDDWDSERFLNAVETYLTYIDDAREKYEGTIEDYYGNLADTLGQKVLAQHYNQIVKDTGKSLTATQKVISANSSVVKLISNNMEKLAARGGTTLREWKTNDPDGDFNSVLEEVANNYIEELEAITDPDVLKSFLDNLGTLGQYRSVDDFLAANNVAGQIQKGSTIYEALTQSWIDETLGARERLFKQIFDPKDVVTDTNGDITHGKAFNDSLDDAFKAYLQGAGKGLVKTVEQYAGAANSPTSMAYVAMLGGVIDRANTLFAHGYSIQAERELQQITKITDSFDGLSGAGQTAVYGILSAVDWSSRESIQKAIDAIEEYTPSNADLDEVKTITEDLYTALNNVVIQPIAAYADYVSKIGETSKALDTRIGTANSGMDLNSALEEYNKFIASAEGTDKNLTFQALYTYDNALGKFVYTQQGLAKWVERDAKKLKESSDAAKKSGEEFDDAFKVMTEEGIDSTTDLTGKNGKSYEIIQGLQNDYKLAIENNTFVGTFKEYFEQRQNEVAIAIQQADAAEKAYLLNNKSELIKAIDWNSLASGKMSNADKSLLTELLGKTEQEVDQWWNNFMLMSAEEKANEYERIIKGAGLTYDNTQRATVGEIISTASSNLDSVIEEILKGDGAVLSEVALDLLQKAGRTDLFDNAGRLVIEEGQNAVDAALELLESLRSTLSVADYLDKKRNIFSSAQSLAAKGITGTMTAADLQAMGYDFTQLNGKVTNTAEGYKWTAAGAAGAYSKIKAQSPLQAAAFVDAMASEKEYNDYAKVLAHVRELTQEIAKAATDGNNDIIPGLREQLALYQDIAGALQEQGDAFNFMGRALPTGIQNISDYFENVGDALLKLKAAVKDDKGEMDYKDFYNMMSHMESNLKNVNTKEAQKQLEQVQQLMTLAAQTAHNVDGTWSVNILKLCQSIGISTDDLGEAFTDSIQNMAKQQIEWIDAQIALLEGLTVLENVDLEGGGSAFDQIKSYLMDGKEGLGETSDEALEDLRHLAENFQKMNVEVQGSADWFDATGAFTGTTEQLKAFIDGSFAYLKEKYGEELDGFITWLNTEKDWMNATNSTNWNFDSLMSEYQASLKKTTTTAGTEGGEETPIGVQLLLHSDGAKATLTIGGNSFTWDNTQGTLADFVTKTIDKFVAENPDTQLPESLPITIDGIRAVSNDAAVNPELTYTEGVVKITGFGAENSDEVKTKIAEWASAQGIQSEKIPEVKPAKIETGGTSEVSVEIVCDVASKTYKFGKTECASKDELLGYVNESLKDTGVTLDDITDGTNLTIKDGKVTLASVTTTANSDSKIECVVTLDATSVDDAAAIETNKTKITNWQTAVKSAKDGLAAIEATDTAGLDNTTESYDATKNAILSVGLSIEITDNGIVVTGNSDFVGPYDSVAELLAKIWDKYTAEFNGNIDITAPTTSSPISGFTSDSKVLGVKGTDVYYTGETGPEKGRLYDFLLSKEGTTAIIEYLQSIGKNVDDIATVAEKDEYDDKNLEVKPAPNEQEPTSIANELNIDEIVAGLTNAITQAKQIREKKQAELDENTRYYEQYKNIDSDAAQYYQTQIEKLNADIAAIDGDISELEQVSSTVSALQDSATSAEQVQSTLSSAASAIETVKSRINNAGSGISTSALSSALSSLVTTINEKVEKLKAIKVGGGGSSEGGESGGETHAKGNVALAKGTLMGELGPEMVVANGRYFVAGQNGAEFVDLPDDAIVFNHLQTASLMANGHTGRGRAVNGVKAALAAGNWNGGPAKASASDAIAQLKRLRDMWSNLLGQGAADLGKKGAGGGGGSKETKAIIKDIDRWYNLMRQIAKLEQQITLEQKQRANMASGEKVAESLEKELRLLEKVGRNYKELSDLQKSYYEARRKDQQASQYSMFFTYDEDGLMQYRDENYHLLEELQAVDVNGKAKLNAKQQVALLKSAGFDVSVLKTAPDGTAAKDEAAMMENFYNGFDGWIEELDGIYDSYHDYLEKIEDNTAAQRKIFEEFRENQLTVEQLIVQAIEDRDQTLIDQLRKEYDVLKNASDKYIEGLNKSLAQEREMYQNNQNSRNLTQLQRQLAILQRSGGSASAISSLQSQIDSQLQDQYFNDRENEIEAIQEASNKQLEKMQVQIDLMTEILEYEKENGLWWPEVYNLMENFSADDINAFVTQWTKSLQGLSSVDFNKKMEENLKNIEEWCTHFEYSQQFNDYFDTIDESTLRSYDINTNDEFEMARVRANAKSIYAQALRDGASEEEARQKVDEYLMSLRKYRTPPKPVENTTPAVTTPTKTTSGSSGGGSGSSSSGSTSNSAEKEKIKKQLEEAQKTLKSATTQYNNAVSRQNSFPSLEVWARQAYGDSQSEASLQNMIKNSHALETRYNNAKQSHKDAYQSTTDSYKKAMDAAQATVDELTKKYNSYSAGGNVDYTGLAMVHGTPSKPEAFISAADRELMKSSIFSSKAQNVAEAFEQFEKMVSKLVTKYDPAATNGMNIENISINLDSGSIANDYDARRAAETVMDEIVKIARQSANLSLNRR